MLEGLKVRLSRYTDEYDIEVLYKNSLGILNEKILENIDKGRYFVAEYKNRVIAMLEVRWSKRYRAYELNYACVLAEYRNEGVMSELLGRLVNNLGNKFVGSAWRLQDREFANMHKCVSKFGFNLELRGEKDFSCKGNVNLMSSCAGCNCSYEDMCTCHCDLYVRNEKVGGCGVMLYRRKIVVISDSVPVMSVELVPYYGGVVAHNFYYNGSVFNGKYLKMLVEAILGMFSCTVCIWLPEHRVIETGGLGYTGIEGSERYVKGLNCNGCSMPCNGGKCTNNLYVWER